MQITEDPNLKTIPEDYFAENFRLAKSFFAISTKDQSAKFNEGLNKYLEIVESNLVRNIQGNFDFFTDAFNNFDGMKEDLKLISDKA